VLQGLQAKEIGMVLGVERSKIRSQNDFAMTMDRVNAQLA
jgi:hypothetical protein